MNKKINVPQPKCISDYNTHMDGVEKRDWVIDKYRIKIHAKKWYFPVFTNPIDMAVMNADVLYCMANDNISILEFRRIVTAYKTISKKFVRPSLGKTSAKRVPDEIRMSLTGHVLERTALSKQRNCAVCKKNLRKQCPKCNVDLQVYCVTAWHQRLLIKHFHLFPLFILQFYLNEIFSTIL